MVIAGHETELMMIFVSVCSTGTRIERAKDSSVQKHLEDADAAKETDL